MNKKEFRNRYKMIRNNLAIQDVVELSAMICDHVNKHELFRNATGILAYYPLGNEVDIRPIVEEAWRNGKRVAFPLVEGETMSFYEVNSFADLREGYFGVMEPEAAEPVDWPEALMLVPGVAFSKAGGRMGFGKGFYDRYLASHEVGVTLGIGYACQYSDDLVLENHDVPLEYMVSELGLHKAGK